MLREGSTPWAIQAEKLHKDYPGLTAVKGLDLSIPQGVVHGFLGPNGAGKSTSIRMMCGLLRPSSGRVLVEGVDPVTEPNKVKSLVGLLPETPPLYRDMTVNEFLFFTARLHGLDKKCSLIAIERVLEMSQTGDVRQRLIGNLSKGYRQRVGIAQALIHDPQIVILDEPTAGLDPESVVEVRALIKSLKQHKTVVFSSHLLHEVEEVCDTISIIAHGELVAHGGLKDVRALLGGVGQIVVEVASCSQEQWEHLRMIPWMTCLERVKLSEGERLIFQANSSEDIRAALVRLLVTQGLDVWSLIQKDSELEQVFLALTKSKEVT